MLTFVVHIRHHENDNGCGTGPAGLLTYSDIFVESWCFRMYLSLSVRSSSADEIKTARRVRIDKSDINYLSTSKYQSSY